MTPPIPTKTQFEDQRHSLLLDPVPVAAHPRRLVVVVQPSQIPGFDPESGVLSRAGQAWVEEVLIVGTQVAFGAQEVERRYLSDDYPRSCPALESIGFEPLEPALCRALSEDDLHANSRRLLRRSDLRLRDLQEGLHEHGMAYSVANAQANLPAQGVPVVLLDRPAAELNILARDSAYERLVADLNADIDWISQRGRGQDDWWAPSDYCPEHAQYYAGGDEGCNCIFPIRVVRAEEFGDPIHEILSNEYGNEGVDICLLANREEREQYRKSMGWHLRRTFRLAPKNRSPKIDEVRICLPVRRNQQVHRPVELLFPWEHSGARYWDSEDRKDDEDTFFRLLYDRDAAIEPKSKNVLVVLDPPGLDRGAAWALGSWKAATANRVDLQAVMDHISEQISAADRIRLLAHIPDGQFAFARWLDARDVKVVTLKDGSDLTVTRTANRELISSPEFRSVDEAILVTNDSALALALQDARETANDAFPSVTVLGLIECLVDYEPLSFVNIADLERDVAGAFKRPLKRGYTPIAVDDYDPRATLSHMLGGGLGGAGEHPER